MEASQNLMVINDDNEEFEHQKASLGSLLHIAARAGNVVRVTELLDQGAAVDWRDKSNLHRTPLIISSANGHREVVTLLFDRGADIHAIDDYGDIALSRASLHGHLDVMQILVARGSNIHHMGYKQFTPLLNAALKDHLPVCEFLLSAGADLMAATDPRRNWTPLSHYGHLTTSLLSDAAKTLRSAALEAAWGEGPHPSQVQRRKDERWERRWPFMFILATQSFRPLQYRLAAAPPVDPAAPISQPLIRTRRQRHAHLLSQVLTNEGIVRLIVRFG